MAQVYVVLLGAVPTVHVVGRVIGSAVAEHVDAVAPDVRTHVGVDTRTVVALPPVCGLVDNTRKVRVVLSRVLAYQVHVDPGVGIGCDSRA